MSQIKSYHTVAIIGTAGGSKDDNNVRLSKEVFDKMVIEAHTTITKVFGIDTKNVILISGGAAWGDHVAVELYKSGNYRGLEIYFPCEWKNGTHFDSGKYDWRTNPGRLSNSLHKTFSKKIGRDSQEDFTLVSKSDNVKFKFGTGFHTRNTQVAKSEYMIAFTFETIKGGTADTWNKSKGTKQHIDLDSLCE